MVSFSGQVLPRRMRFLPDDAERRLMTLHKFRSLSGLLCLSAILATSCGNSPKPEAASPAVPETHDAGSPAGPDSGQPNLAVGSDGTTYLSWIETDENGEPALKFSALK